MSYLDYNTTHYKLFEMKKLIIIVIILILGDCGLIYAQTLDSNRSEYNNLKTELYIDLLDTINSTKRFDIKTIYTFEIPEYVDYKGVVISAIRWNDLKGDNILIQSYSGKMLFIDTVNDSNPYLVKDRKFIYSYLFVKEKGDSIYRKDWRMQDEQICYIVDGYSGFIPDATTVTDIDEDGVAEICIPYVLICRGGLDPGTMKVILYEDSEDYILTGQTRIGFEEVGYNGGEYEPSGNLKGNKVFYEFLIERWNMHVYEGEKFF